MAYTNTLKVFETLRVAFDEKQSTRIAEAVEAALETNNVTLLDKIATKADLAQTRADIIEWIFIFWIGQFAAIVGVLTAILFSFFKR